MNPVSQNHLIGPWIYYKKNKKPRNAGHIKKDNMGSKLRNTINARYG